jgi:flagellum-specific ATP synthase
VFGLLGRLLERAGTAERGSITGLYTVLVEGDDHNEPIADAARSILDGHVVLDRKLALAGHFPAIDVLASVSRVASRVSSREHRALAGVLRRVLAARANAQDLLDVGAYQPGSNPLVDAAVNNQAEIAHFLQQDLADLTPQAEAWERLSRLVGALGVPA